MPLILGSTPYCDWLDIVPLLERIGVQPESLTHAESWYLTELEVVNDSNRYLLVLSRPEIAVARALANGEEPEEALKQWLNAARAMVSFFKHHRRQSVMVNLAHLQAEPKVMLKAVCGYLNLSDEQLGDGEIEETLKTAEVHPLNLLLATQLVRQNPYIESLLAQIEACCIPLEGHDYTAPFVDVAGVLKLLKTRELEAEKRSNQLASVQEALEESLRKERSNAALVEQLQRELELHKGEVQSLDVHLKKELSEKQSIHQEKDRLHRTVLELKEKLAESENENNVLLEQLHLVQEELEKQFKQLSAVTETLEETRQNSCSLAETKEQLERELDKRANRILDLEQQLEKTQKDMHSLTTHHEKDKAEKVAVKEEVSNLTQKLASVQSNVQRLQQENELLLEQLHLVQEELERQILQKKQLQTHLDESRQSQDHALEVANREIRQLQDRLNSFRSSKAWKATAPIRVIGKPFRRNSPENKGLKRQTALVKRSGLFDQVWYLTNYPDVASAKMDPIEHYLKFGAKEGRNPSPEFDTSWYLSSYPDVAQDGMNPLVHYIKFGRNEQRAPRANYFPSLPAPHGDQ